MACHSCHIAKLEEYARTRRGRPPRTTEMQSQHWAACRIYEPLARPCPGCLQPPVHPLRDAVDILDDFDFVDTSIPAANIRSVHTLAWVHLAGPAAGWPPRSSPRLKLGSGTAVRPGRPCTAGHARQANCVTAQGTGDSKHASRQLDMSGLIPRGLLAPRRRAISALSLSTSPGSSIASITTDTFPVVDADRDSLIDSLRPAN